MGRHEDFPDIEFTSFPPRKMLYASLFTIVAAFRTYSTVVLSDYYCPKKMAAFMADKEATRERVQATIQSPVFISVNEKLTAIAVDNRLSTFDTDDFARARTVMANGNTGTSVDFITARKLLAQLSQAPVANSKATVTLP